MNIITEVLKELTDKDFVKMLNTVEPIVKVLTNTEYFRDIETQIKTSSSELYKQLEELNKLNTDKRETWLTGLQVANESKDLDKVVYITALFIAAQRNNLLRVEDAHERLFLAYIHIRALKERTK